MNYLSCMKASSICFLFLLFLASCGTSENKPTSPAPDSVPKNNVPQTPAAAGPDTVTFGVYCGECAQHCATMFRYDWKQGTLYADFTDSFFKDSNKNVTCNTAITDAHKKDVAKRIAQSIPDTLLHKAKTGARFGCPDCADGCGIYLEIKDNNGTRKFYIDRMTDQLSGEIKKYAELILPLIDELKK